MPTSWSEGAMETLAAARRRGAARVNERGQGFNPSPAKPGARNIIEEISLVSYGPKQVWLEETRIVIQ